MGYLSSLYSPLVIRLPISETSILKFVFWSILGVLVFSDEIISIGNEKLQHIERIRTFVVGTIIVVKLAKVSDLQSEFIGLGKQQGSIADQWGNLNSHWDIFFSEQPQLNSLAV